MGRCVSCDKEIIFRYNRSYAHDRLGILWCGPCIQKEVDKDYEGMGKLHNSFLAATKQLSEKERNLLLKVHSNHAGSMSADERKRYTLRHITKVERQKANCLNVHFSNGDWFHYTPRGEWF